MLDRVIYRTGKTYETNCKVKNLTSSEIHPIKIEQSVVIKVAKEKTVFDIFSVLYFSGYCYLIS